MSNYMSNIGPPTDRPRHSGHWWGRYIPHEQLQLFPGRRMFHMFDSYNFIDRQAARRCCRLLESMAHDPRPKAGAAVLPCSCGGGVGGDIIIGELIALPGTVQIDTASPVRLGSEALQLQFKINVIYNQVSNVM